MKRKTIFIIAGVAVVLIGGFLFIQSRRAKANMSSLFQTEEVKRGDLVAIVGATGTVHAEQSATLTWQTSGTINEVNVEVGDLVKEDEILTELKSNSLPQTVLASIAELPAAQRELDNLNDSDSASAKAQLTLAQAQTAYQDALDDRNSLDYGRASQNTLDGLRADYVLAQDAVDQAEEMFGFFEDREADDAQRAQALTALVNARKLRDRALYNLNYALGKPDPEEVAEADAKVEVAKASLDDAQREWDRLKDGVDPDDLAAAQARVDSIKASIDMAKIKSPFKGTVTEVKAIEGNQVSPGTMAVRVDSLDRLMIDLDIPEVDITRVEKGQEATLTFDALPNNEYEGVVSDVARAGTVTADAVDFTVSVLLDNPDENIRPGLTAAVNIVVSKLENQLLIPNRAVRIRDGKRVVYLQRPGVPMPEPVEITILASSDLSSSIKEGTIKEGDLVVLNPPAEMQQGPGGGGHPGS
jgi:HlyD family secretion protein